MPNVGSLHTVVFGPNGTFIPFQWKKLFTRCQPPTAVFQLHAWYQNDGKYIKVSWQCHSKLRKLYGDLARTKVILSKGTTFSFSTNSTNHATNFAHSRTFSPQWKKVHGVGIPSSRIEPFPVLRYRIKKLFLYRPLACLFSNCPSVALEHIK